MMECTFYFNLMGFCFGLASQQSVSKDSLMWILLLCYQKERKCLRGFACTLRWNFLSRLTGIQTLSGVLSAADTSSNGLGKRNGRPSHHHWFPRHSSFVAAAASVGVA